MSKDTDALNLILHIHRIYDQTKLRIEQGLFDVKEHDLYNYIASIAFDVDEDAVTPGRRTFIKTCLFGAMYGASPQTILDATRKHRAPGEAINFGGHTVAKRLVTKAHEE